MRPSGPRGWRWGTTAQARPRARPLSIGALVLAALLACGARTPAPRGAPAGDAVVIITSNVADAQLYIDGHLVGPVSALRGGIAIDPGKHRMELRHDDYFSRYVELDLQRAAKQTIAVEMMPVLP